MNENLNIRSRRPGHKIRVTASDISPQSTRVFVDDVELSHYSQFKLEMGVGKLNTATIEFYAGDIEIDAEALAILKARQFTELARPLPTPQSQKLAPSLVVQLPNGDCKLDFNSQIQ